MKSLLFSLGLFGISIFSTHASTMMNWIGTYSSESTPWRVTVHKDKPSVFGYDRKIGVDTSISPSAWRPHDGWFVWIENDDRLWAFDGSESLLMFHITKEGGTVYEISTLPMVPPSQVLQRLPDSIRHSLSSKFSDQEVKAE
jgi:hypothetical protein